MLVVRQREALLCKARGTADPPGSMGSQCGVALPQFIGVSWAERIGVRSSLVGGSGLAQAPMRKGDELKRADRGQRSLRSEM